MYVYFIIDIRLMIAFSLECQWNTNYTARTISWTHQSKNDVPTRASMTTFSTVPILPIQRGTHESPMPTIKGMRILTLVTLPCPVRNGCDQTGFMDPSSRRKWSSYKLSLDHVPYLVSSHNPKMHLEYYQQKRIRNNLDCKKEVTSQDFSWSCTTGE